MLTVDPRGSTKLETELLTPRFSSAHSIETGKVAEEDDVEKAISEANLGLNPMNNGEMIIINVPALTEERRKELVKQVKLETENGKVSIRSSRQKANDEIKKIAKEGASEDLIRDGESQVQDLTNEYIKIIDHSFEQKQQEIMTI